MGVHAERIARVESSGNRGSALTEMPTEAMAGGELGVKPGASAAAGARASTGVVGAGWALCRDWETGSGATTGTLLSTSGGS